MLIFEQSCSSFGVSVSFHSHIFGKLLCISTHSNGPRAGCLWGGRDLFLAFGPVRICHSLGATVYTTVQCGSNGFHRFVLEPFQEIAWLPSSHFGATGASEQGLHC